jgi:hypothetical protein
MSNKQIRRGLVLVALGLALVLLWVQAGRAQEPASAPQFVPYYLPMIQARAFPAPAPEAEGQYRQTAVNLAVWMGDVGAPEAAHGYDWLQADTLLTYWERRSDGALDMVLCWYGAWPSGSGGARCDLYR